MPTKDDDHKYAFQFLLSSCPVFVLFSFRINSLQPVTWTGCSLFWRLWLAGWRIQIWNYCFSGSAFMDTLSTHLASSWVSCTFTCFRDNFGLLEMSVFLMRPDLLSKWLCKCMWICVYVCDFEHIFSQYFFLACCVKAMKKDYAGELNDVIKILTYWHHIGIYEWFTL